MTTRLVLGLALLPSVATAGTPNPLESLGTIYMNDCGVWNDPEAEAGVVMSPELPQSPPTPFQDVSYGGSGSNHIVVRWNEGGVPMEVIADSVTGECGWSVQSEGRGRFRGANSGLVMRKGETVGRGINGSSIWYLRAYGIGFEFQNTGTADITDLRVFHASDPEIDEALNGVEATVNDVYDSNDWGYPNWAIAMGEVSNITIGYYACREGDAVGFLPRGADLASDLIDPDGAIGDLELVWRSAPMSLAPGDSALTTMTMHFGGGTQTRRDWGAISWSGTTLADHYAIFRGPRAGCSVLDQDGDGLMTASFGGLDCNDSDETVGGAALYWRDTDGDGFGDPSTAFSSCSQPSQSVPAGGTPDCNDGIANINPDAEEVCDGLDNNCNDDVDEGLPLNRFFADTDDDGFGDPLVSESACDDSLEGYASNDDDCDDTNRDINPDEDEITGNSVDEDCDDVWACWTDNDGDTFGISVVVDSPDASCLDDGEATNTADCDDTNRDVNPDGIEITGNSIDEDCDELWACFTDNDGDTFGTSVVRQSPNDSCSDNRESPNDRDCDDTNADINPDAAELAGNTVDENCDDSWDCFVDGDGDTFGTSDTVASDNAVCTDDGEAANSDDCDDTRTDVSPNGFDIPGNNVDEDCNGTWDCFIDDDDDGFAMNGDAQIVPSPNDSCTDTSEAPVQGDCNDSDPDINPDATEIPGNAIDEDCDDSWDCFVDGDGDDFGSADILSSDNDQCTDPGESPNALDCDDDNTLINPNATEVAGNSVDEDCDMSWDCFVDGDGDDYGISDIVASADSSCFDDGEADNSLDCDDGDASINPDGVDAVGTAIDADCDGSLTCFVDADGDGFGTVEGTEASVVGETCDTDTTSSVSEDCNDDDDRVFPGAEEIPGNDVDEDCNGDWECFEDDDGDGFAADDADVVISDDADCDDEGESAVLEDCDDADASVSPDGSDVVGSGIDSDCDGFISCFADEDGDGFGDPDADAVLTDADDCDALDNTASNDLDCDDSDAAINPDADEIEDNDVDEDCDGVIALSDEPDTELDPDTDMGLDTGGVVQGGCGCDAGGQNAGWLALGLLPLLVRRRQS